MVQESSSIRPFRNEVMRKLLHLPVFIFPAVALYSQNLAIVLIVVLMVGYVGILFLEKKFQRQISFFSPLIKYCKRNVRYDYAPLYLSLGMLIAILISEPIHVFFAAYVIAICDSLAALVGMKYGRFKIFYLNKTYLGSLVFLVLCLIGALYYLPPYYAFLTALALALTEIISLKGTDNLTLPVMSQLILIAFI